MTLANLAVAGSRNFEKKSRPNHDDIQIGTFPIALSTMLCTIKGLDHLVLTIVYSTISFHERLGHEILPASRRTACAALRTQPGQPARERGRV